MQKIKQDIYIGGNLRRIRIANGLTQDKITTEMQLRSCHIARSSYSRYETGELNIPVSHLVVLKIILKCEYNDFFSDL